MSDVSFAEYLSGLGEAALTRVLAARPDVRLEPAPEGFTELAQRLGGPDSLVAALRTLNRDAVVAGQLVAALGDSATEKTLARVLAAPDVLVRDAITELRERGLLWIGVGTLQLPERLAAHWAAEIGGGRPAATVARTVLVEDLRVAVRGWGVATDGLRKPELTARLEQRLSDLSAVVDAVRRLPRAARDRLNAHRYGHAWSWDGQRHRGLDQQLVHAGLALPVYERPEVPAEVAVAAWLAENAFSLTGPPSIPAAGTDPSVSRPTAQSAAHEALRALTGLLDQARVKPIAALKNGGVGARERARLARALSLPTDLIPLWIDLAHAAGLLGHIKTGYAPTEQYAEWRAAAPGRRWAALAAAWFALEHAPLSRRVDDDKEQPPPLPLASAAGAIRCALLTAAGSGKSVHGIGQEIDWFFPLHGYPPEQRDERVGCAIREGELLGVIAGDGLTELGQRLVEAGNATPDERVEELARSIGTLLPAESSSVILQSDLTAVVSGQPSPAAAELLASTAVSETRGTATVWRFTPASVRGALDAGRTADELLHELKAISDRPVPQPLEYLISDAARRHGEVRVRGMRSCLVGTEGLMAEILHTRRLAKLQLSQVAPTVLASPFEPDEVLTRLRAAGLSPVAEDAGGTVIVERREGHRAPRPGGRAPVKPRATIDAPVLARRLTRGSNEPEALVTSETVQRLAQLNPGLDDAELRLLADAVDRHADVRITYRNKQGNRSIREIRPEELYGRWLVAWCHLRNGQREFTVANVESVAPAC